MGNENLKRIRDLVTTLNKYEQTVQVEHHQYKLIIDILFEGVWITDENEITKYVNRKCGLILGYNIGEMIDQPFSKFINAEDIIKSQEHLTKRYDGIDEVLIFNIKCKDGTSKLVEMSQSPIINESGEYKGTVTALWEVDNAKLSILYKELFFDYSEEPLMLYNFYGKHLSINNSFAKLLGYKKEEINGEPWEKFTHQDDLEKCAAIFEKLLTGNDVLNFNARLIHREGYLIPISWRMIGLIDKKTIIGSASPIGTLINN